MNRAQLTALVASMPADAKEIIIKDRHSTEIFFTSEVDVKPYSNSKRGVVFSPAPTASCYVSGKRWRGRAADPVAAVEAASRRRFGRDA